MSLYKYRVVGDLVTNDLDPHLFSLLSKGEIYFANPKEFNDPFDCLFAFHKNVTDDEIIKHLRSISISEEEIQYLIRRNGLAEFKDKIIEKNENADLLRIFSLTSNCLSTLMWSHYSQNHYGVCIGFKTYDYNNTENLYITKNQIDIGVPEYQNNLVPAIKITYSSERPEALSIILKDSDNIKKYLLQKINVGNMKKKGELLFHVSTLREILFRLTDHK
jgi:hypothetical protein